MTDDKDAKIDVSGVAEDQQDYIRKYFGTALEGRSFGACSVTWSARTQPEVSFHIVFDDGSRSETLQVSSEAALEEDRSDAVVYDDSGARTTVLGFVEAGVLKGVVDGAFSRKAGS